MLMEKGLEALELELGCTAGLREPVSRLEQARASSSRLERVGLA